MTVLTNEDITSIKNEILEEEKKRKTELYRNVTKETSYKKGEVTKDIYKLPMPSGDKILKNREIMISTYGHLILKSNFGGHFMNPNNRYIYENKLNDNMEELAILVGVKPRTLRSHIAKLKKCNVKIIKPIMVQNSVVYLLSFSIDSNKFVSITNIALRKLCNAYSENTLRIYLILNYMCIDTYINNDTGETIVKNKETLITQKFLCDKIGLSQKSRKLISDCIDALEYGGFINVRTKYTTNVKIENGREIYNKISNKYYSLSEKYLKIKE